MQGYLGDFTTSNTVYVYFNTFDSNDPSASVTLTGLAVTDIEIYKDGSTTQRSSDSGYSLLDTDGIDFDGITGIHGFSIDLSDNTDAGFYAAGSEYTIVVSSVTVDAATINFIAGSFSIERAGGALALLKNGTYGLSALDTELGTLATAAELAKVPKSDGSASWNATALAAIVTQVIAGLDTAIGVPTAGSPLDILADLNALLPGTGTLSTLGASDINAEVLDVLNTDTFAEPSSVPAATATIVTMIHWIYTLNRNKMTQTTGTTTLRNDADSADIATSSDSDDGTTATIAEWI